jgi:hypothetical protein
LSDGDHPTLYVTAADFSNPAAMMSGERTGRLFAVDVPVGA